MQLAAQEAHRLNHALVDTEHLLLGLLIGEVNMAQGILEAFGIDPAKVRKATMAVLQQKETETQHSKATYKSGHPGTNVSNTILDSENLGSLFTEQARRVIELAEEEARLAQHGSISTGHLLLGLVRESEGSAAKVLCELGVELSRLRAEVTFVMGSGGYEVLSEIGFAERTKRVIERAVEIANASRQLADTEHLLLALAQEERGISVSVFKRVGVHQQQLRERVLQEVGQSSK
jgi:ATP-dependent Clp protease ATP-binding subunit ClpA